MSATVTLAVLLSALLHAAWNAMVKGSGDRWLTALMITGFGALVAIAAVATVLDWPQPHHWPWLLGSGTLHSAYFLLLVNAYAHGDLGRVYPIARGIAPLIIIALSAPLLGEVPGPLELAGLFILVSGILLIAGGPGLLQGAERIALIYTVLTGAAIAAYSMFDAVAIRALAPDLAHAPVVYVSWITIITAIPICGTALAIHRGAAVAYVRRNFLAGFGGAVIAMASYALVLFAFAHAPVAAVAAIRETGVVFAALIGTIFLGERFGRRRIPAAILVAIGVAALKLFA